MGRTVTALAVSALAAWVVSESVVVIAADWQSSQVRLQISRWVQGQQTWDEAQWLQAESQLAKALSWTPQDATLHEDLALLYTLKGQRLWGDGSAESPGVAFYGKALTAQQEAIKWRPMQPSSWANLTLIHYAIDSSVEDTFAPWRQALRLGPNETEVKQTLKDVASAAWQSAPPDVLAWLEAQEPGSLDKLRAADATLAASAAASAAAASR